MNLILILPHEWPPVDGSQRLLIEGRRAQHIAKVIKPDIGSQLTVGLLNGLQGTAKVIETSNQSTLLEVELSQPSPPGLPVTLVLALPRPLVFKRLLQSCTAMGIKDLYIIQTARVEKSYWQSPNLAPEAVLEQLYLGLEQGRDTLLPKIQWRQRFKPFIEDELPTLCQGKQCFLAHPADNAISAPTQVTGPSMLAIGPEGGFVDYEVEQFQRCGFQPFSLGPRILKVETALAALLGRLYF